MLNALGRWTTRLINDVFGLKQTPVQTLVLTDGDTITGRVKVAEGMVIVDGVAVPMRRVERIEGVQA